MSYGRYGSWKPYVPVAARRANADKAASKLEKSATGAQPVRLNGNAIATSFWGKAWCRHLEAFSDFENRLPRGRSYVRSNAVCHLAIKPGRVEARVMGSSLYTVSVDIRALTPTAWSGVKRQCVGGIDSLLKLLQGRLSDTVMRVVTDRNTGLFPKPGEMTFDCSCPDWADMCKHVAATLYGVGNRLDLAPELLFQLRGVDAQDLIASGLDLPRAPVAANAARLADDQLGAIFGVDLEPEAPSPAPRPRVSKRAAAPPKASNVPAKVREFRATARTVRALRIRLGLSVSEFAERLSVSSASIARWEGSRGPLRLQARCLAALTALQSS